MADISDVEQAFVAAITAAVYPNGTSAPSAIVLPGGAALNCRIYAGWPLPETLDPDMAAGNVVNVSVFPQAGMERNVTRFPQDWQNQTSTACTLTAAVSGATVTIGGAVTVGHYVTLQIGGQAFSYAAQASDTLASVAAALAALIAANMTASASGAVITVPSTMGGRIVARCAAPGTAARELERTTQRFIVTIWAPNNACRVAAARIIRPALAALDFLGLPDGYAAELKYESSTDVDRTGKQNLSCRDIFYWAEYPTTQSMVAYPMTTFSAGIEGDNAATVIEPLPLPSFTPATTVIS
ncbi:MAG TPA: hypothetical protein VEF90_16515 [Xanthobacteraceae bacterium]|nr:hypothetical protein [Xanthobacteraceae bacterium]